MKVSYVVKGYRNVTWECKTDILLKKQNGSEKRTDLPQTNIHPKKRPQTLSIDFFEYLLGSDIILLSGELLIALIFYIITESLSKEKS